MPNKSFYQCLNFNLEEQEVSKMNVYQSIELLELQGQMNSEKVY